MDLPALYGSCGFAALGRQVPALVCHFKNLAGSGVHLFLLDLFSGEESLRNAIFKQGIMWLIFVLSSLLCGALLARMPGFLKKGEVA